MPQSSCSLSPMAPALICSSSISGRLLFPLPVKPRLIGSPSAACNMRSRLKGPGLQVVAHVPVAGPLPPPISVVRPDAMAVSMSCGQMKWTCVSRPPAVTIIPSPEMTSVPGPMTSFGSTPDWISGLPGLADPHDPAVADADVPLHDPPIIENDGVGDHEVEVRRGLLVPIRRLALPVANDFAAAEDDFLAIDGEVLFDLDDEIGVAQADAVADSRPVMPGVGLATQFLTHAGRSSDGRGRLLLFLLRPGFLFR